MWWIDYLETGFTKQGPLTGLILFRIIFALCCLLKFSFETKRGYFHYFNEDSYLFGLYQVKKTKIFNISTLFYKLIYIVKVLAAACLLIGLFPKLSMLLLLISFFFEIQIYFKFHTNFYFLIVSCLFMTLDSSRGGIGSLKSIQEITTQQGDLFPQILIMVTLTVMYLSTVYRKMNPVFLSGIVIHTHIRQKLDDAHTRKHFDGVYPTFITNFLVYQDEKTLTRRWKPMMIATLLMETLIPVFLWFESTLFIGVIIGIFMHTLFALIAPGTLTHFSLITIGTYILFFDPQKIVDWLTSI